VLHCLTYPDNPSGHAIGEMTMRDAMELVGYFHAHALRVLPLIGQDTPAGRGNLVGRVATILQHEGGAGVLKSVIGDRLGRNYSAGEIDSALAQLAAQGLVEAERFPPGPRGGRPAEAWRWIVQTENEETRKRENLSRDAEVVEWTA
jgi:hypothetical protein